MTSSRPANRLASETSPYLLQHAHNPVDWYPWGPDAFALARREDKPVLLSVGYSACHWCHVMERESFENDEIAALMNRLFVSIKVDREERPDVDQIYMQAVQSMTGRGGWPMTVFLTPDGVPFYGGTYFPPVDRHGMPAFPRLLQSIADAYHGRRGEVLEAGRQLVESMQQSERLTRAASLLTREVLVGAYLGLSAEFDERDGGLGQAPKFPQPMTWEAILRVWKRTGDARALAMLRHTLTRMARGGIYDQLGGGFHRYSVDGQWLVPHFEKMLYDNAQLASLYLHAWLATGEPEYRRVTEETLDYALREMTHPAGGFYSAQDADSEGVEGKFFVWSPEEIRAVLGDETLARTALAYWGVADGPNFEGHNILFVPREPAEVAGTLGLSVDELAARLARARRVLQAHREKRVHPALDDKVLASWNGLTLAALAEAAAALGRPDYLAAAVRNAKFLTSSMVRDGRLLRSWKDGQARITGYLEDHAMVGAGLLALYEATFDRRWLDESRRLAEETLRLFWNAERETFFDTGHDQESLVVRPRNIFDNAVPSGTSVTIEWLLKLAIVTGEERYEAVALQALRPMADVMQKYPSGFGRYLSALDFHLGPVAEVALVWPAGADAAGAPLAETVFRRYQPNRVVVGAAAGAAGAAGLPLLAERGTVDGKATAYVCRRYVCQLPVTEPEALARQLDAGV
ncbi:MAG TPA: thioredoxin domain-containing protein [Candidatus Deferrimicrobiaceae bacterium]|nr:thioredoxin domain-containing protein [Candidatus Deferrimicrobiaceae bacterium]